MFSAEPVGRHVREDCLVSPERHLIQRWQILVAGAGTLGENELYGRPIIADGRLAGKYVAYHALDLKFEEPGSVINLFVYAYLLTRHGTWALRATSYGTKILSLRRDLVAGLFVPMPPIAVQERVASLIRRCVEQRDTYLRELKAARKVIEDLPEMKEAESMRSASKRRPVLWTGSLPTLRAWNFASTGPALGFLAQQWRTRLSDVVLPRGIFKGGRLTRIDCQNPYGVDLLSQRDVFAIRPVPRRIQKPVGEDLEVNESMLLLASRGQLNEGALFGQVERGCHMPADSVVTEDIMRLCPKEHLSEGLWAFFSTPLGRSLLRSTAFGTSIPGMRVDLLHALPVPDPQVLLAARDAATKASRARVAAANAEVEAIRIIEEEVLPSWLT